MGTSSNSDPTAVLRVIRSVDPALPVGLLVPIPADGGIIGRLAGSAICLPGNTVSRRHARLIVGTPWRIEALTESNALFVDGEPVTGQGVLHPGGTFQVGGVVCALVHDEGTTPVLTSLEHSVLLRVRRDAGAASVYTGTTLLEIGTREALVLAELIDHAGTPVHRWDLLDLVGESGDLDKVISTLRRALREAFESGTLSTSAFGEALDADGSDPAALVKALLKTRRGHGYVLTLDPGCVAVEDV